MADLGAIGFSERRARPSAGPTFPGPYGTGGYGSAATATPTRVNLPQQVLTIGSGTVYTLSGTVSVLGTPTSGLLVRAYRRDNGAFLGEAVSAGGGAFSIKTVGYNGEVTVIAYDNTGVAPDYNAEIFDRVIPV